MARYTIAVAAKLAQRKIAKSKRQCLAGNQADIRKNPHVIDVGSRPGMLPSYWCVMLMGISTILNYAISKQYV
jgi:hypothetical protein